MAETSECLKIQQKKVFFYRVFYGNQREAGSLEGKLDKQGEMTMRVWEESISLVSNFQETLIRRYGLFFCSLVYLFMVFA